MTIARCGKKDDEFSLFCKGHAGYADIGNDIVCAGISTLTQTLIAYLVNNGMDPDYLIEDGLLWIYCKGQQAVNAYEVIITGLRLIRAVYPDNLKIKEGCPIIKSNPLE